MEISKTERKVLGRLYIFSQSKKELEEFLNFSNLSQILSKLEYKNLIQNVNHELKLELATKMQGQITKYGKNKNRIKLGNTNRRKYFALTKLGKEQLNLMKERERNERLTQKTLWEHPEKINNLRSLNKKL